MQVIIDTPPDIRSCIAAVGQLRAARALHEGLDLAVLEVKSLQSRRFESHYADLLSSAEFAAPTQFFLSELYGTRDYSQRDAQFSRIAGTLERMFPAVVVDTALQLAQLHALSESLDDAMARISHDMLNVALPRRYVYAWRETGHIALRRQQLTAALQIGQSLNQLTGKSGLRTMLKMMRGPASAAGLAELQRFLEQGFDTFSSMRQHKGACDIFLNTISTRESAWIDDMFTLPTQALEDQLSTI